MALDLGNLEQSAREAIKAFWGNRAAAADRKRALGRTDQGNRGAVTAGKHMDGFLALAKEVTALNGPPGVEIYINKTLTILPGYFRSSKQWDLLVVHQRRLIAAIEFKSQVGSTGKNVNNRAEEALGSACDLWTAYREQAYGESARPFVGWLMVVEDGEELHRSPKRAENSKHFPIFPEFRGATYAQRYDLLCRRLVKEQLYSAATVLLTPRDAVTTGAYSEVSSLTGLRNFVSVLAGTVAAEAARTD